ncbi:hypothetical protein O9929_26480 [Vibrio lentus]|nr:hypothetical protein [Vibrio lentus]
MTLWFLSFGSRKWLTCATYIFRGINNLRVSGGDGEVRGFYSLYEGSSGDLVSTEHQGSGIGKQSSTTVA